MRTQLEFISDDFPAYPGEEESINPGIWGKRLAEYLAAELPKRGVRVGEFFAEDWGWLLPIENEAFPMFIGCGNQMEPGANHFLCFIDPSKPEVRLGLFKKVSTVADVERVAKALEEALKAHPGVRDLSWED